MKEMVNSSLSSSKNVSFEIVCPVPDRLPRQFLADQDVVARGGKFWVLYKRGGHRVLINKRGDLVVRPNPMEASVSLVTCFGSVQHHLLTTYLQSLLAVLLSQFSTKQMKGGMQGVLRLARLSVPLRVRLPLGSEQGNEAVRVCYTCGI